MVIFPLQLMHVKILCMSSFLSFFLYLFNTVPLHSLKYNSQRLNRRNREEGLVTSWSKELISIKVCRDEVKMSGLPSKKRTPQL